MKFVQKLYIIPESELYQLIEISSFTPQYSNDESEIMMEEKRLGQRRYEARSHLKEIKDQNRIDEIEIIQGLFS